MAKKFIKPTNLSTPLLHSVFNFPFRTKCIVLAIIAFIFYANTIPDKYVFDDNMSIVKNSYVKMGFAGIPKILTNDSYLSYYANSGANLSEQQLSGGRYRPLSEIIFAVEQQLF